MNEKGNGEIIPGVFLTYILSLSFEGLQEFTNWIKTIDLCTLNSDVRAELICFVKKILVWLLFMGMQ
jgi:hypothetical protein